MSSPWSGTQQTKQQKEEEKKPDDAVAEGVLRSDAVLTTHSAHVQELLADERRMKVVADHEVQDANTVDRNGDRGQHGFTEKSSH